MKIMNKPNANKKSRQGLVAKEQRNDVVKTKLSLILIPLFLGCFAQAGTPPTANVNVVNTPNVNVANTPTVNVGTMPPVQVDTSVSPLLVRDVDSPVSQPFAFNGFSFWSVNNQTTGVSFTVPAGKRLVIEQVSAQANVTSIAPTKQVTLYVSATAGGTVASYYFTGTDVGEFAGTGRDWVVASSQTRSYADAGTTVSITAFRSYTDNYSDTIYFYLSGYLVNVP